MTDDPTQREAHRFLQSYLGLLHECGQELERLLTTDERPDTRQQPEPALEPTA